MKEDPNMDIYASNGRIDELLNSFIDGELTARQEAEVERLIADDVKAAQRLRQLQKCKVLVGSLPCAEAPAEVLEGIKASLATGTLAGGEPSYQEQAGTGSRQLLVRTVLSAAAMIGLVAVLTAVIYTIATPEIAPEGPVAIGNRQPPERVELIKPSPGTVAAPGFSGRLELKTSALVAVDAFINRAIEDNGLSDSTSPAKRQNKRIYSLSCSRQDLDSLLAGLEGVWSELDSATLFVNTEAFGEQVVVEAVTAEQIAKIVDQNSPESRIRVAKDFAALNNMSERLPGGEILSAIEGGSRSLLTIPKPALTGGRKVIEKPTARAEDKEKVRLTIIVSW